MTQAHIAPAPAAAAAATDAAEDFALAASAPATENAPVLDAEKLVAYHLALELQVLCAGLVPANHRVLQDQLERASLSVCTNVAEGAGRRSRRDKRRMYSIARGSAMESAAIIDVLRARRLAPESACAVARSLALRIVQVLTKLDASLA